MRNLKWAAAVLTMTMLMISCSDNTEEDLPYAAISLLELTAQKQNDFVADCTETERTNISTTIQVEQEASAETENKTRTKPMNEKLYDYEIKTRADDSSYAVIKGFQEGYEAYFNPGWNIVFPEQLGGAVVAEFAPHAFRDIPLGNYSQRLWISPNVVSIGAHCFENCGLSNVTFEMSSAPLAIHEYAFSDNPELWGIYFSDREVVLENNVFEDCAETGYLCYTAYKDTSSKMADQLKSYAASKQWDTAEIPAYYSSVPLVAYPETPLILKPEVRSFFYGENAPEDGQFCSFEYDENAPDYGFPEWHIPCGEFCAMAIYKYDIETSSTLSSNDEKYIAENLGYWSGREHAWAEGAQGYGIGESICITSCCGYQYDQDLYEDGTVTFLKGDIEPDIYDGYMRYTQICVVNGYAKNQKTWEENGRVKRLLMYVEDRPYAYLELEDTIEPQYFTLPFDAIKTADSVDTHFRFVIEEVYTGTKYEDTCLTGLIIDYMGRRGH